MSLQTTDLILRPSILVSNTIPAQNGGRMVYSQIVSGVKNNLFPDVSAAERLAGLVRFRKVFWHLNADTTDVLTSVRVYMDRMTQADDYLLLQAATATGTEDSDYNGDLLYGVGGLASDISAGAVALVVALEHPEYLYANAFRTGMLVRISNKTPGDDSVGTEEFVRLVGVSVDTAVSIYFDGSPLTNAYSASNTIVSAVIETATVSGGFNGVSTNTVHGTLFQAVPGNITVPSKGSIEEAWTLLFNSPTDFIVSGASVGTLDETGSISADYSPINANTATPYFTILSATWSGSFAAGESVTFNTTQAVVPLLIRQRVPAGSGSLAGNVGAIAISGSV